MQVERKILWVVFVAVLVNCCCLAQGRRGIAGVGGIYGQELRHLVQKGKSVNAMKTTTTPATTTNAAKTTVSYSSRSLDNHHNIPRQNYDNWGSNGSNGDNSGGDNGSG